MTNSVVTRLPTVTLNLYLLIPPNLVFFPKLTKSKARTKGQK